MPKITDTKIHSYWGSTFSQEAPEITTKKYSSAPFPAPQTRDMGSTPITDHRNASQPFQDAKSRACCCANAVREMVNKFHSTCYLHKVLFTR